MAIVQTGILFWTLGIGTLLSLVVSDKNLMIPIAIFLVGFDMFLVFNPASPTRRLMAAAPGVTQNVFASVPQRSRRLLSSQRCQLRLCNRRAANQAQHWKARLCQCLEVDSRGDPGSLQEVHKVFRCQVPTRALSVGASA